MPQIMEANRRRFDAPSGTPRRRRAMPQWCDRQKKHTIDEVCDGCQTKSWATPSGYSAITSGERVAALLDQLEQLREQAKQN